MQLRGRWGRQMLNVVQFSASRARERFLLSGFLTIEQQQAGPCAFALLLPLTQRIVYFARDTASGSALRMETGVKRGGFRLT